MFGKENQAVVARKIDAVVWDRAVNTKENDRIGVNK